MAARMIANDVTNGASQSMNQLTSPLNNIGRSRSRDVLQRLNDRLASYIESMRILDGENSRLNAVLESTKESHDRETMNMKKLYADELARTHKCLNEVASEKTKLAIDHTNALVDNDNLKNELEKLRQQLEETQENLKNEIVARVDSENTVLRLREELMFQDEIHSEELNETRRQLDTSEIDIDFSEQYNAIEESLQALRDQYEDQIRSNRNELKLLLDGTMKNERNCLQRENESLTSTLQSSYDRNELMHTRIGELEKLNAALNAQTHHLESALAEERTRSAESVAAWKILRQELDSQIKENQDLIDVKSSLSLELDAYNQLLCNGEQRLKFEPAAKRYRKDIKNRTFTSSSTGNIEIVDADSAGKFIKLRNKNENEVVLLGGWKLIRQAGGSETVHEFDRSVQLAATADLIVWSADSSVSVSPVNIVGAQKWIVGDETKIMLVNDTGKEEAKRIQTKLPPRIDEHHQLNGEPEENGKKCKVM